VVQTQPRLPRRRRHFNARDVMVPANSFLIWPVRFFTLLRIPRMTTASMRKQFEMARKLRHASTVTPGAAT